MVMPSTLLRRWRYENQSVVVAICFNMIASKPVPPLFLFIIRIFTNLVDNTRSLRSNPSSRSGCMYLLPLNYCNISAELLQQLGCQIPFVRIGARIEPRTCALLCASCQWAILATELHFFERNHRKTKLSKSGSYFACSSLIFLLIF